MDAHIHRGALIDTPERARDWARRDALNAAGCIIGVVFVFTGVAPLTILIGMILGTEVGMAAVWIFIAALATLPVIAYVHVYRTEMQHFAGPCR